MAAIFSIRISSLYLGTRERGGEQAGAQVPPAFIRYEMRRR